MPIVSGGSSGSQTLAQVLANSPSTAQWVANSDGGLRIKQISDIASDGSLDLEELSGQGSALINFKDKNGSNIGYFDGPDAGGSFRWGNAFSIGRALAKIITQINDVAGEGLVFVGGVIDDDRLSAGDWNIGLDPTPAATKLMIKAKDSGGTVRTATINLA